MSRIDPANISTLFPPLLIRFERLIRSQQLFSSKFNVRMFAGSILNVEK